MRIVIIGDVHGRHRELADRLAQAQADYRVSAAIQVGDFGFEKTRLEGAWAVRFPIPVHALDGNHEDHRWLRRALLTGAARRWPQELNLIYQPRGSLARFGSTVVGFLGGALHVDRPQSHNWLAGLPNYLLPRHRQHALELFNRENPELVVTHSCPSRIGIGVHATEELKASVAEHVVRAGFDPGPEDDCGEIELTRLWHDLAQKPRAWVFGHFHRDHEAIVEGTQFVCVSDVLHAPHHRWTIWDTEEKKLLRCPADPSAA